MKPFALPFLALAACAGARMIPGTPIEDTRDNREILETVERYRRAMERRDAPALLAMAHPWYHEDSGTAKAADDYGVEGLGRVLANRLERVKAVRYGLRYRDVQRTGDRVRVHVFIDASFQITTEAGDRWERKADDNQIELIRDDRGWRFLSGM